MNQSQSEKEFNKLMETFQEEASKEQPQKWAVGCIGANLAYQDGTPILTRKGAHVLQLHLVDNNGNRLGNLRMSILSFPGLFTVEGEEVKFHSKYAVTLKVVRKTSIEGKNSYSVFPMDVTPFYEGAPSMVEGSRRIELEGQAYELFAHRVMLEKKA